MAWWRVWSRVLGRTRTEGQLRDQVADELAHHLEMLEEEYVQAGMSPEEARAAARHRFGDYASLFEEACFERNTTQHRQRRSDFLGTLAQDVRFGLRSLRLNPGFTAAAVLTLALGIGATTAVYSVVDAVLFRALPYDQPERVVALYEEVEGWPFAFAAGNLRDWQARTRTLSHMAAIAAGTANLTGGDSPLGVSLQRVSAGFFDVFGVGAEHGRTLVADDEAPDAEPVAVLSWGFWQRAMGADPDVVGRVINLDDVPYRVVGITPASFAFTSRFLGASPELWVSRPFQGIPLAERGWHTLFAVGRLAPRVTIEQARAELKGIAAAVAIENPQTNQGMGAMVEPLQADLVREARPTLLMLLGAVALVLLIACVNVANLLLSRASARQAEMSLRTSLGAGRLRLARQALTESALLGVLGGMGGVGLAAVAVPALLAVAPVPLSGEYFLASSIPLLHRTTLDGRVLGFALVCALFTVLLFGLAPAWRAAAGGAAGVRSGGSGRRSRRRPWRHALVVAEVAMALVLLIGVGLLTSSFRNLSQEDLGFRPESAHAVRVELARTRYAVKIPRENQRPAWELRAEHPAFVRQVVDRMEAIPWVEAAGAANLLPFQSVFNNYGGALHVEGREPVDDRPGIRPTGANGERDNALFQSVTPDYFRSMAIPLLGGRAFTWSDAESAPRVVIVNQALASRLWPDGDALGRRILSRDGAEWRDARVVGVVADVQHFGFKPALMEWDWGTPGILYVPYLQPASLYSNHQAGFHTTVNFTVRHRGHRGDGEQVGEAMRRVIAEVDPETPVVLESTLAAYTAENVADRRFYTLVVGAFSALALVLALIGIYGVMAYRVGRRRHEIGVRIALGAARRRVVGMVVREGLWVASAGAAVGVGGALAATRLLSAWLYGVSPTDPTTYAVLSFLMVGVAVMACLLPARSAARTDPMDSLRVE